MIKYRKSSLEEENQKEELLLNITDEQKGEAIAEYLDRCKLKYANLYYQWRKKHLEKYGTKLCRFNKINLHKYLSKNIHQKLIPKIMRRFK